MSGTARPSDPARSPATGTVPPAAAHVRNPTTTTMMYAATIHSGARPNARTVIAHVVRGMRAQLRWRRDQLDFQLLGLVDTTPAPAVTA